MSNETGGPAFPVSIHPDHGYGAAESVDLGMTLRDYFAARAMQGIISVLGEGIQPGDIGSLAGNAYMMADAMLKERGP